MRKIWHLLNAPRTYLAVVTFVHIVFLLASLINGVTVNHVDSEHYLNISSNLLSHGVFYLGDLSATVQDPMGYSLRTPLYPLVLAALRLITGSIYPMIILQNVLSISVFYWLRKILQRYTTIPAGPWLILGLLLFPNNLILTNLLLTESMFQFLVVAAFYFLDRFDREQAPEKYYTAFALCLSLALLTRPILLFWWMPLLVFSLYLLWKKKRLMYLVAGLLLPLTILLWSYRNEMRTGYRHYSSIKNINLVNYNLSGMLSLKYGQAYADSVVASIYQGAVKQNTYAEKEDHLEKQALEEIRKHAGAYFLANIKGTLLVFLDVGRLDWALFLDDKDPFKNSLWMRYKAEGVPGVINGLFNSGSWLTVVFLLVMIWNVVALAGFILFGINLLRRKIPLRLPLVFLLLIVGYLAMITGPYGVARFKVAFYPLLLFALILVLDLFARSAKNRKTLN